MPLRPKQRRRLLSRGYPSETIESLDRFADPGQIRQFLSTPYKQARGDLQKLGWTPDQVRETSAGARRRGGAEGGIRTGTGRAAPEPAPAPTPVPEPAPAPAPEPPEYDPNAPDILAQMQDRYLGDEFGEIAADRRGAGARYGEDLLGIAEGLGTALSGTEGYGALQDYAGEMQGIYDAGGLTDVTRANLEAARRDEDQWIRAQREAQLQDLAERGMQGGGAEIAALVGDRASAADRMSARDLETNAFAQQQALEALASADEANRELYSRDREILGTVADAGVRGTEAEFDIDTVINDAALGHWNDIDRDIRKQRAKAWDQGRSDVLPASTAGADRVEGAVTSGKEAVHGELEKGVQDVKGQAAGLTGLAGTEPPQLGLNLPPVETTSGAQTGAAATEGIGNTLSTVASVLGSSEDEEEPK